MNKSLEITMNVNKILEDVLGEINQGKSKIFNISDRLRDEYEERKKELDFVKNRLYYVLSEVDELEKLDKNMRNRLVIESKKLDEVNNALLKEIYDQALDIRVKYITKQNEEKELIQRRDSLQRSLKNYLTSIHEAENAISQISIAIDFLKGNLVDTLNNNDEKNKFKTVIKILENQENEKKRIARDIHDGPSQYIANVIMRLDFTKLVIKKDVEQGLKEIDDLKVHAKRALKEIRTIIYGLKPIHLEELGLIGAIEHIQNEMINDYQINMSIECNKEIEEVESVLKTSTYRIVQEILNNSKKHAKAKNINLKLSMNKGMLNIFIEDDGIGFDFKETLKKLKFDGNKYGVIGIIERVNQLEGKIKVNSKLGNGTRYNIDIPVIRKVD